MKTAERDPELGAPRPREHAPAREAEAALAPPLPAHALPPVPSAPALVRMQRMVGNAQVQRMLAGQAVGPEGGPLPEAVDDAIAARRGAGAALAGGVREEMEEALGTELAGVRVHTGAEADTLSRSLGARAFTTGRDVFFRTGEFAPSTPSGRRLLAHELTHVVQQSAAPIQRRLEVGPEGDEHEREAERVADAVSRSAVAAPPGTPPARPASGGAARSIRRQPDAAPAADAAPVPGDAPVLRADEKFAWVGATNAPTLVIRRSWLVKEKKVRQGVQVLTGKAYPGVLTPLLNALVDHFPWAHGNRRDVLANVAEVDLLIPPAQWQREEIQCNLGASVFLLIGLPGQAPVQVFPLGNGFDIYADLRTLYPPGAGPAEMQQARPGIALRMASMLEEVAGLTIRPALRPRLLRWLEGELPTARRTAVARLLEKDLDTLFGAEQWSQARGERRQGTAGAVLRVAGAALELPSDVSRTDRERVRKLLEDFFGKPQGAAPAGPPHPLSSADIRALLALEKDPNKDKLVEELRKLRQGGSTRDRQTIAELVETLRANEARRRVAKELDFKLPEPGSAAERPVVNRPVRGRIVNRTGELVPGMEGKFEFQVTDAVDFLRVPMVSIQWIAVRYEGGKAVRVESEMTRYIEVRGDSIINDRVFEVDFDKEGLYEIHAFVTHNFYLPRHFSEPVQVETEHRRLEIMEELTTRTFGKAGKTQPYRFADVQADTDEDVMALAAAGAVLGTGMSPATALGSQYAKGLRAEGELTAEAFATPGGGLALSRRTIQQRLDQLDGLVKDLRRQEANADLLEWAEGRRKRLQETLDNLKTRQETSGVLPVLCQGHYVTRKEGVSSGPLELACWVTFTPGADGQPGTWHAHLVDHTELLRAETFHLQAEHAEYPRVMEKLFYELTRTYPDGTMSFSFQLYEGLKPTRRYVRFERVTDTVAGDFKDVVFSDAASVIVNIAAAVLTVFPPTAPLGIAISIAYNSAQALSSLAEAQRTGTVRASNYLDVGLVALDVIPLLGKGTRIMRVGGVAYRVVDAGQYAGMAYLFTEGTFQQVQQLRDGKLSELARLQEDIRSMERFNRSHPELEARRRRAEALKDEIRGAAADLFAEAALHQGLTLAAQHTAGRLAHKHLGGADAPDPRPGEEDFAPPVRPGEPRAARPGEAGMERPAGEAVRDARVRAPTDAALAAELPLDLRGRLPVHRGPPPDGNEVRVHYVRDRLGLISEVFVRAGPAATARDVALHADTVRLMERYRGFSGAVRVFFERLSAYLGGRRALVPGSSLFEAAAEVEKLPRIIAERARQLSDGGLDPEVRRDLQADLDHLWSELRRFQRVLDQAIEEAGVGFVAARAAKSNQEAIAAGYPELTGENAAPDHYYYKVGDKRFELRMYANSAEQPKRLEWDAAAQRWRVKDRVGAVRAFPDFVEAQKGAFEQPVDPHSRVETALTKRFAGNQLDQDGVSVARRWSKSLDTLQQAAGGGDAGDRLVHDLLKDLGPTVTDAGYKRFRRAVRTAAVDLALRQPHPAGGPDERVLTLRRIIQQFPDQRTQGETFTQFRARLAGEAGTPIGYLKSPGLGEVPLAENRKADGRVEVTQQVQGGPAPGMWLMEDKSGAHAFKEDQARFYSGQLKDGTIKDLNGVAYQGIIYVFENRASADRELPILRALHPNVKVAAFNDAGGWEWLR